MGNITELWLGLSLCGIFPKDLKSLYEKYSQPDKIIEFIENEPLWGKFARNLRGAKIQANIKKIIKDAGRKNIRLITFSDSEYPDKLKNIFDPPPVLFVRGQLANPQNQPVLGVVGTRGATLYGKTVLEKIIPPLVRAGFIITSGLALGIDALAHQLTLTSGGQTWAFLGNGVDRIYPPRNRFLYEKIPSAGALVSEFPPGTDPRLWHFPQRNRLISGVADGVLVVEADYQSGALITAKCAADQGREVMAIPGSLFGRNSAGCHWLIKQGAALIEKPEDILEIFGRPQLLPEEKNEIQKFSATQKKIMEFLGAAELSIEDLIEQTGLPAAPLSAELMTLIISGVIKELPGQRYLRN